MGKANKLGLGTVQWGIPYGISNENGITTQECVREILSAASNCGVTVLDTASLYGDAEIVLGACPLGKFNVVTKTARYETSAITDEQSKHLTQTFLHSLECLSVSKVYGLLIHHPEDLLVPGGEKLVSAMLDLKDRGVVEKIGVSVYDCDQVNSILRMFNPDILQVPINVFDQRMLLSGCLERMSHLGIEIHARSVFLQGLLLMPLDCIPAYFDPIRPLLTRWHNAVSEQGLSCVKAALSFVRDIPYVDAVLVGVESVEQFKMCAVDFEGIDKFDASDLACNDLAFINPALWSKPCSL